MKNYILVLLLLVFSFITVHDYIIVQFDADTQSELMLQENGKLDIEQMCSSSQVHHSLHDMLVAAEIVAERYCRGVDAFCEKNFFYRRMHDHTPLQTLYRPPIA